MCSRCGCLTEREPAVIRPAVIEGGVEAGLLLLLAQADGYGYDLASELTRRGLVPAPVPPARVYEALRRLEADGALTGHDEASPDGPARRRYHLTPLGHTRLARWAEALRQTERSLRRLRHTYDALRLDQPAPKPAGQASGRRRPT